MANDPPQEQIPDPLPHANLERAGYHPDSYQMENTVAESSYHSDYIHPQGHYQTEHVAQWNNVQHTNQLNHYGYQDSNAVYYRADSFGNTTQQDSENKTYILSPQ